MSNIKELRTALFDNQILNIIDGEIVGGMDDELKGWVLDAVDLYAEAYANHIVANHCDNK